MRRLFFLSKKQMRQRRKSQPGEFLPGWEDRSGQLPRRSGARRWFNGALGAERIPFGSWASPRLAAGSLVLQFPLT